jgi:hypothetical protein
VVPVPGPRRHQPRPRMRPFRVNARTRDYRPIQVGRRSCCSSRRDRLPPFSDTFWLPLSRFCPSLGSTASRVGTGRTFSGRAVGRSPNPIRLSTGRSRSSHKNG